LVAKGGGELGNIAIIIMVNPLFCFWIHINAGRGQVVLLLPVVVSDEKKKSLPAIILYRRRKRTQKNVSLFITLWVDNFIFIQNGDYYYVNIGPFNSTQTVNVADFVLYYGNAGWNNNGGDDWHININNVINIKAEESEQTVSISPNPMSNYTFVKITDLNNTVYDVQIIDISGQIIVEDKFESNQNYVLQRNNMQSGVYFIRFIDQKENKYFFKKLIVN